VKFIKDRLLILIAQNICIMICIMIITCVSYVIINIAY